MHDNKCFESRSSQGPFAVFVCDEPLVLRRRVRVALAATRCGAPGHFVFDTDELLAYCRDLVAAAEGRAVFFDVRLDSSIDYAVVRDGWVSLMAETESPLTMRISLLQSEEEERSISQLVVDVDDHHEIALQNKLEVVARLDRSPTSVLVTSAAPLVLPRYVEVAFLATDPRSILFDAMREVTVGSDSRVVFLRNERPGLHLRVARAFWKQLFTNEIPEVLSCNDQMQCEPLRLFRGVEPSTLYVFPERMLPVRRAYYVRALDLLLGLNYGGEACAVMIFGPRNKDLQRIKQALEIFSPHVTVHPLRRGKFPLHHRFIRRIEMFLRKRVGFDWKPPLRFIERCYVFGTRHNTQLLSDTVQSLSSVRNVIYTGPWFTPAVLMVKNKYSYLKWYCDTIDVFYVLDRDSNARERRFFYNAEREKTFELRMLNSVDGAIAISDADRKSLEAAHCESRIVVESGSFSHVTRGVDFSRKVAGLIFGFIGSNNTNNEKCLALIREEWWPEIVARAPEARLLVAGGVCESAQTKALQAAFPESIQAVGFVDVLAQFYNSVHAMLSPIAVQGGLNFKSVESLMAGRPLVTNELGSRCLGEGLEGIWVVGQNAIGIDALMECLFVARNSEDLRLEIHEKANARFCDEIAYASLITLLKANLP